MKRIYLITIVLLAAAAILAVGVGVFRRKAPGGEFHVSTPGAESPYRAPSEGRSARTPSPPAPDADQDGLSDLQEQQQGTDPTKPDTDGDGLTDFDEVVIYETDPLKPDTDGDGFADAQEIKGGYDPRSSNPMQLP